MVDYRLRTNENQNLSLSTVCSWITLERHVLSVIETKSQSLSHVFSPRNLGKMSHLTPKFSVLQTIKGPFVLSCFSILQISCGKARCSCWWFGRWCLKSWGNGEAANWRWWCRWMHEYSPDIWLKTAETSPKEGPKKAERNVELVKRSWWPFWRI